MEATFDTGLVAPGRWKRRLTLLALNLTLLLVLAWMHCCARRDARRARSLGIEL